MHYTPLVPCFTSALRPGPVQNMTVTAVAEQGGTLSLNVSWMGPLRPEGRVRSYFICVGSPRATTLNDKTVTVEVCGPHVLKHVQNAHKDTNGEMNHTCTHRRR